MMTSASKRTRNPSTASKDASHSRSLLMATREPSSSAAYSGSRSAEALYNDSSGWKTSTNPATQAASRPASR